MRQCWSVFLILPCIMQMCAGDINITIDGALRYIKNNNLTLNNAHIELQKHFGQYNIISGNVEQSVFNSSFWHFLKAPTELQNKILAEIGFESPVVQENFRHIPLYYALEWISTCRHKAGEMNLIHPQTRCLLDYEQFYCVKKILDFSARAATNKELADNYIAEYKDEQVTAFAFITSGDKKILSSLPDKFVQAEHALLKDILIAEKPSMISRVVGTPLSMMLHSVREPFCVDDFAVENEFLPAMKALIKTFPQTRMSKTILLGFAGFVAHGCTTRSDILNFGEFIFNLFGINITLSIIIKVWYDGFEQAPKSYNTCIIKPSIYAIDKRNAGFIGLTPFVMLARYYLFEQPFKYVLFGLPLALAPFMIYDYFKYPRKYAVKTQTIAELIASNKKEASRRPMCTLL